MISPSRSFFLARLSLPLLSLLTVTACSDSSSGSDSTGSDSGDVQQADGGGATTVDGVERPDDWTAETHEKGDPLYDLLFDDTKVQRIDIELSAADYQATQDDLVGLYGEPGTSTRPTPGGGGDPGGMDSGENPIWVPVTVHHDGHTWWEVGMRYKGNSSLRSAWSSRIAKLSFRLNFDKYELENPELDDQRFYGFKKMTFSSGFSAPTIYHHFGDKRGLIDALLEALEEGKVAGAQQRAGDQTDQ